MSHRLSGGLRRGESGVMSLVLRRPRVPVSSRMRRDDKRSCMRQSPSVHERLQICTNCVSYAVEFREMGERLRSISTQSVISASRPGCG